MADVDELSKQAHELALRNPPSRVFMELFLFPLVAIGWICGRTWFYGFKFFAFCGLAIREGYRQGVKAKVQVKPPAQNGPPANLTSYGPNVQAYSEPG